MRLRSSSFSDGARIPERCAFGIPDPTNRMKLGPNRNPQLSWSGVPGGTKSLVLICTDPDVPSSADDLNQEGRTIAADLPRVDFVHWVMVDIRPTESVIEEAFCSDGVIVRGKSDPAGPPGSRQGINDYTGFMADDADMQGDYHGYDGPCPPWNDERLHHYNFVLYAIDQESCPVQDRFTGADVQRAIEAHVLAEARLTGIYSLNPEIG